LVRYVTGERDAVAQAIRIYALKIRQGENHVAIATEAIADDSEKGKILLYRQNLPGASRPADGRKIESVEHDFTD
jgi:hypothetical protein